MEMSRMKMNQINKVFNKAALARYRGNDHGSTKVHLARHIDAKNLKMLVVFKRSTLLDILKSILKTTWKIISHEQHFFRSCENPATKLMAWYLALHKKLRLLKRKLRTILKKKWRKQRNLLLSVSCRNRQCDSVRKLIDVFFSYDGC